jgi:hypothetical protein
VQKFARGMNELMDWGGRALDAMTRLLVNVLPNVYHWRIVHPLHRICGKWIKLLLNHMQHSQGTHTDRRRDQKGIEIGRRR